jgi:hypothetical protein
LRWRSDPGFRPEVVIVRNAVRTWRRSSVISPSIAAGVALNHVLHCADLLLVCQPVHGPNVVVFCGAVDQCRRGCAFLEAIGASFVGRPIIKVPLRRGRIEPKRRFSPPDAERSSNRTAVVACDIRELFGGGVRKCRVGGRLTLRRR